MSSRFDPNWPVELEKAESFPGIQNDGGLNCFASSILQVCRKMCKYFKTYTQIFKITFS